MMQTPPFFPTLHGYYPSDTEGPWEPVEVLQIDPMKGSSKKVGGLSLLGGAALCFCEILTSPELKHGSWRIEFEGMIFMGTMLNFRVSLICSRGISL